MARTAIRLIQDAENDDDRTAKAAKPCYRTQRTCLPALTPNFAPTPMEGIGSNEPVVEIMGVIYQWATGLMPFVNIPT